MSEIKTPKNLLVNRTTKLDLEISTRVNSVLVEAGLWSFDPPVRTIACFQKGLLFSASSTNGVYALMPINYENDQSARRRLNAAQKAMEAADGYTVKRDGWWLLIRPIKAT